LFKGSWRITEADARAHNPLGVTISLFGCMLAQRPRRARELSDERILGSGEFVDRILKEADARALRQHAAKKRNRYAERVVAEECRKSGVSLTELRSGSRRGRLPEVRTKIVRGLVENYGVGVAEVARQVGISTSGVSKILSRTLSN
jgi:putative transposase